MSEGKTSDRAVGAGRGLLYITGAKIWFMVGASAIGFVLPHLLSKVAYGVWGTVLSWVSPVNNVLVTATIQAVAKFAARGPGFVEGTKRSALRVQLAVAAVVAIAWLAIAPLISALEHDASLTAPLRLATGVSIAYAFYAVFVGAANGAREFHKQAGLDATFTTLRTVLVFTGAIAFGTVFAAVGGFVAAAVVVLAIAIALVKLPRHHEGDTPTPARELFAFMAPVALYLFILNALMFIDGWVLKRLVAEAAEQKGLPSPASLASEAVAVYTAAQSVARIPYQGILSVTFVIFPLVSSATFAGDADKTRGYIEKSIRWPLLIVLALASAVAARPEGLLNFFPAGYQTAGNALAILAFAYVAFSLLSIAGTIINGAGHTLPTTIIGVVTLALDLVLTWAGVRWALATGHDALAGAALGTSIAMTLGFVLSLVYLQKKFRASLRLSTVLRGALASAAAIGVGRVLPLHGKLGSFVVCAIAGVVFIVALFVLRELTPRELRALRR